MSTRKKSFYAETDMKIMLELYQSRFLFVTETVTVTFLLLSHFLAYSTRSSSSDFDEMTLFYYHWAAGTVYRTIKVQILYPGTSLESREKELSFDTKLGVPGYIVRDTVPAAQVWTGFPHLLKKSPNLPMIYKGHFIKIRTGAAGTVWELKKARKVFLSTL